MAKRTLNENQLYSVVENMVREYLRESYMAEDDDIAGVPEIESPEMDLAETPAEPTFEEPMAEVKEHIYKMFRCGGAARKEKALKYVGVINNTVNATARKHPEWNPDNVEFHIVNKYLNEWIGKVSKKDHKEFLKKRREEWNSEENAETREAAAQKKRDARAAAKVAARGEGVPMMEGRDFEDRELNDWIRTATDLYREGYEMLKKIPRDNVGILVEDMAKKLQAGVDMMQGYRNQNDAESEALGQNTIEQSPMMEEKDDFPVNSGKEARADWKKKQEDKIAKKSPKNGGGEFLKNLRKKAIEKGENDKKK